METNTQLIANRETYEDKWKRAKIDHIVLLLQGALRAESMVGLKMNVPKDKMEGVIEILPSLDAPTVANLYQKEWLSVEAIIERSVVRDLIPKLLNAGAKGIIEYSLNKVI